MAYPDDTALDTEATPIQLAEAPPVQMAQAQLPPMPNAQVPGMAIPPPALPPTPAPAPPPAATQQQPALQTNTPYTPMQVTGVPPTIGQTPGVSSSVVTDASSPDVEDDRLYGQSIELDNRRRKERDPTTGLGGLRTHTGAPIDPPKLMDLKEHENYANLMTMYEALNKGDMTPKEKAAREPIFRNELARAQRQVDLKNKEQTEAHTRRMKDEITKQDAQYQSLIMTDRTAAEVDTTISNMINDKTTKSKVYETPEESRKHAYDLVATPLGTATPQGLRMAVMSVAAHNKGMTSEDALNVVLALGSPMGTGKKNVHPPMNGLAGKGGTNYLLLGDDPRGIPVVAMRGPTGPDGRVQLGDRIRVPEQTLRRIQEWRGNGYKAGKKFEADYQAQLDAKDQPGFLTRNLPQGVIDFFTPNKAP